MGTLVVGSFANEQIVFEVDYNDANLRVSTLRCVNNGDMNARGTLIEPEDGSIVAQAIFVPGTTQLAVAGNKVKVLPNGTLAIPYETRLEYPA